MDGEEIVLGLDKPESGCSRGTYQVAGWALSGAEIRSVEVFVDRAKIGDATLGHYRPDVAKLFPMEKADRSGFFFALPWTISRGKHAVSVRVRNARGREAIIDREFEVDGRLLDEVRMSRPKWLHATLSANELREGVNVAGYFRSEKGMGEAVRSDIRSLEFGGIPYALNDIDEQGSASKGATVDGYEYRFLAENAYPINLIHVNADMVHDFMEKPGADYLRGRYNIGYWTWELSDFPRAYHESFYPFDEIWVPSKFVLDAISRVSPIPVVCMPHNIIVGDPVSSYRREHWGLREGDFVFSFMFDFHSVFARKNPLGVVKAFKTAFSPHENIVLLIKSSHSESSQSELAQLREEAQDFKIKIFDEVWTREKVWAFMQLTDCYVSLHRSEGFGLTLVESMALGKPVLATAYSGNMDYMNHVNSYLVRYELVEIDCDYGPYKKGFHWAEPDIDDAARLMREVFEDRDRAHRIGERAAEDVRRCFSPRATGPLYRARIEQILRRIAE